MSLGLWPRYKLREALFYMLLLRLKGIFKWDSKDSPIYTTACKLWDQQFHFSNLMKINLIRKFFLNSDVCIYYSLTTFTVVLCSLKIVVLIGHNKLRGITVTLLTENCIQEFLLDNYVYTFIETAVFQKYTTPNFEYLST